MILLRENSGQICKNGGFGRGGQSSTFLFCRSPYGALRDSSPGLAVADADNPFASMPLVSGPLVLRPPAQEMGTWGGGGTAAALVLPAAAEPPQKADKGDSDAPWDIFEPVVDQVGLLKNLCAKMLLEIRHGML